MRLHSRLRCPWPARSCLCLVGRRAGFLSTAGVRPAVTVAGEGRGESERAPEKFSDSTCVKRVLGNRRGQRTEERQQDERGKVQTEGMQRYKKLL